MPDFLYREMGPSGCGSVGALTAGEVPGDAVIVKLQIEAGDWVNRIILFWEASSDSGSITWGGPGGTAHVVTLNPGERISAITGTYARPGFPFVNSIQIFTSLGNVYGPFGNVPGAATFKYEIPISPVDLGGFYIAGGDQGISAFGVILREVVPQV